MEAAFQIARANSADAEKILDLQKRSFLTQAQLYDDYTLPPLLQTFEQIINEFDKKIFLIAVSNDVIIGSIRGYEDNGTCYVERLFVDPAFRKKGAGIALLKEIEKYFPEVSRYELFTGHKSVNNIYMYENIGYRRTHSKIANDKLTIIFFEKLKQGA